IFFTGHSLGAAMAMLAFSKFDVGPTALLTLGCPRTGNAAFCALIEHREFTRVVDGNDWVTQVPPKGLLYSHPQGSELQIGQASKGEMGLLSDLVLVDLAIKSYASHQPPPEDLADHSPVRYLQFAWERV